MKKLVFLMLTLAIIMNMCIAVSANPNMKGEVGDITVPYATPQIDGSITEYEGWSVAKYAYKDIMATFGNCNDILQSFNLYYAYDVNGLYYAADITDNTFILSTGADNIDNEVNDFNIKDENVYGYNGDIFAFALDPIGLFQKAGYINNTDYNVWYSVGIFENNETKMYRGHYNSGDVTNDVKLAGAVTDTGWRFEAFIPWDMISQDVDLASLTELSATPAELSAAGADHRAMVIYMDRFYDDEARTVDTFQRFATCAMYLADGTPGYLTSGVCLKSYGIDLILAGNGTEPIPAGGTAASPEAGTAAAGGNIVTTKAATTTASSGQISPETSDTRIVFTVLTVAAAAVGGICIKRSKKETK